MKFTYGQLFKYAALFWLFFGLNGCLMYVAEYNKTMSECATTDFVRLAGASAVGLDVFLAGRAIILISELEFWNKGIDLDKIKKSIKK